MAYQVNDIILGTVKSIKPYALFLEFEDGTSGLLHISEISDGFIRDIEKYGTIGDQMKVIVVAVDETNGFLRVSLKKVPKEEAYSSHQQGLRNTPSSSRDEFKTLESKIPEWISETLAKTNRGKKQ